jgi:hypothetical protein
MASHIAIDDQRHVFPGQKVVAAVQGGEQGLPHLVI